MAGVFGGDPAHGAQDVGGAAAQVARFPSRVATTYNAGDSSVMGVKRLMRLLHTVKPNDNGRRPRQDALAAAWLARRRG